MWNNIGFYLAVAGGALLLIAVIAYAAIGSSASKAQTETQNVSLVLGNIDQLYQGYPSGYINISTSALVQAKAFPPNMVKSAKSGTGTPVNQWGADLTVAPGPNSSEFVLTDPGLPTKACIAMAQLSATNVVGVSVNGTTLTSPVDPAAAAAACNKSGHGSSGGNSVAITSN